MLAIRVAGVILLVAIPLFLLFYRGAPDPGVGRADPTLEPVLWPGGRLIWTVITPSLSSVLMAGAMSASMSGPSNCLCCGVL